MTRGIISDALFEHVRVVLDGLVDETGLKAVLLLDKDGECLASEGDGEAMTAVAETHFGRGLDLRHLCRDANGSTVLSELSGDAVRLEAIAGHYILTLVCVGPLLDESLRGRVDRAKRELERLLRRP